MIERWSQFWSREVTNNEVRLRRLGIVGTVMICFGTTFLSASVDVRQQTPLQYRLAGRTELTNADLRPTSEDDDIADRILFHAVILYVIAFMLITSGHSLSRWAAYRQGILSTQKSTD